MLSNQDILHKTLSRFGKARIVTISRGPKSKMTKTRESLFVLIVISAFGTIEGFRFQDTLGILKAASKEATCHMPM